LIAFEEWKAIQFEFGFSPACVNCVVAESLRNSFFKVDSVYRGSLSRAVTLSDE
jgi:hypothetical protein